MGAKQVKPVVDFPEISNNRLKRHQMEDLEHQYSLLVKLSSTQHGNKIEKGVFTTFLDKEFGHLTGSVLERLFFVINYSGSKEIDFAEFICAAYIIFYSTKDERMRFWFNVFDLSASGQVGKKDFRKMAPVIVQATGREVLDKQNHKQLQHLADSLTAFTFFTYDMRNNKYLSYYDWCRYAEDDETLQSLMKLMGKRRQDILLEESASAGFMGGID